MRCGRPADVARRASAGTRQQGQHACINRHPIAVRAIVAVPLKIPASREGAFAASALVQEHERLQIGGRPSSGPKGLHTPQGQLAIGVAAARGMLAPSGQACTAAVAGGAAGGSRGAAAGRRRQHINAPSRIPAAAPGQCSSGGAAGRRSSSSGSGGNWDGSTPGCVLCCFTSLPSLLSRCLQNQLRPA